MQDGFAEAFLHAPHRILGIRLRPFCACHFLHLDAVRNPLVREGASVKPWELVYAIKVCNQKPVFDCGVWQIKPEKIRCSFLDKLRIVKLKSKWYQSVIIKEWESYQEDYLALPERMECVDHNPAPLSSPGIVASVTATLDTLSEERAWTMPLGTMYTYAEVRAEMKGAKIRFRPSKEEEEEIMEQLNEAEEIGQKLLAERMSKNGNA
jgi:hypothetical protein